jgi:hypothetical protein
MKGVSFWFMTMGVIYVTIGMIYGIWMSITQDHSTAPAHAHLNLIGFVLGSIFAFYYHHFAESAGKLRWAHFWVHQVAVVLMFPGIIIAITQGDEGLAKIASLLAVASMVLFVFIHLTAGRRDA